MIVIEHKVVVLRDVPYGGVELEQWLNAWGLEGWRFTGVDQYGRYIFTRVKEG